ncbi:hypothetical protein EDB86DRAFT_1370678 [Lactarius hatsudake]|nr:hypothetical protein EDB86DRAFT_1370678 [Lactarius hatsudake]
MRGVRRVRRHREWEVDGDGSFPHTPDAEATPMISQPHHWNSFFPRNATDRQHLSSRIKQGMVSPAITTAVRSIRRLFGRGPIPVSRVAVPEAFDIESSDSETDPFDTLRSKTRRGPFTNLRQIVASGSDRGASSYTLTHPSEGTRDSSTLDADLESDRGLDHGVANGAGGGNGADDHDNAGDHVMVIGQNFSSGGSLRRGDGSPVEADQSSIEVVPPTPTLGTRVSTFNSAMTCARLLTHYAVSHSGRALTTPEVPPHLIFPPPPPPPLRYRPRSPLRPTTCQAVALHRHHPLLSYYSPLPGSVHAPPARTPFVRTTRRRHRPHAPQKSNLIPHPKWHPPPRYPFALHHPSSARAANAGAHSPPLSPQLQNYMTSFPGRSPPGSPYALPNSVPSSPISASDPQNLIPSAVRGAGYNPFQHGRSTSDLG